jgi:hypothetical protein
MILNITYGYVVHSHDDDLVKIADEALSETVSVTPAAMFVDFFPICMLLFNLGIYRIDLLSPVKYWPTWMPLSGWKRHAMYTKSLVQQMFDIPYNYAKTQLASFERTRLCLSPDFLHRLREPLLPVLPPISSKLFLHKLNRTFQTNILMIRTLGTLLPYYMLVRESFLTLCLPERLAYS